MRNLRYEALVQEHSRLVLNVALRILGNADLAQDVHQEVFLAVWRIWDSFKVDVNWRGYLYRATVRKAIELARKSRVVPMTSVTDNYPSSSPRPDAMAQAEELQKKLVDSLAKLPERQMQVFVMSRIEGLDYIDIAQYLNCSQSTVRVHLYRAMKKISRDLGDYLTEHKSEKTLWLVK